MGRTHEESASWPVRGRTRSFFSALILRLSRRFSAAIGRYYLPDKPAYPLVPFSPGSPFGPGRPRTPLANVTPLSPLKPYNDTARSDPTRSSMCSVNFFCFYNEALICLLLERKERRKGWCLEIYVDDVGRFWFCISIKLFNHFSIRIKIISNLHDFSLDFLRTKIVQLFFLHYTIKRTCDLNKYQCLFCDVDNDY